MRTESTTAPIYGYVLDRSDNQGLHGVHIEVWNIESNELVDDTDTQSGTGLYEFTLIVSETYEVRFPQNHDDYELDPPPSHTERFTLKPPGVHVRPFKVKTRYYVRKTPVDPWKEYLDDIETALGNPPPEDVPTDADKHFRVRIVALLDSIATLRERLDAVTVVTPEVIDATAAGLFGEIMPRLRTLFRVAEARASKPPKDWDVDYEDWHNRLSSAETPAENFANEVNAIRANPGSD